MKVSEIKRLAENHSQEELQAAAEALENEQPPAIEVNGVDEGEQLTHCLGALDCHQIMEEEGTDMKAAVRKFSQRVRNSIG